MISECPSNSASCQQLNKTGYPLTHQGTGFMTTRINRREFLAGVGMGPRQGGPLWRRAGRPGSCYSGQEVGRDPERRIPLPHR